MDCIELSDLEEGEILEYEICPSRKSGINLESVSVIENIESNKKKGYLNKNVQDNSDKFYCKPKNEWNQYEFELISSSDGEYKSEDEKRTSFRSRNSAINSDEDVNRKCFKRKQFSEVMYATAEDIMSEIGETISRQSLNDKRQRFKDSKYNYDIFYKNESSSCEIWSHEVCSSQSLNLKNKYKKRRKNFNESHLNLFEGKSRRTESGLRRKKHKDFYLCNHELVYKKNKLSDTQRPTNKKLRDFDEGRKSLLEKLKKQKLEEKSKEVIDESLNDNDEGENSDVQLIEVQVVSKSDASDSSRVNATDASFEVEIVGSKNETIKKNNLRKDVSDCEVDDNNGDDDDDENNLTKLRLMALASNRKKENFERLTNVVSESGNKNYSNAISEVGASHNKTENINAISENGKHSDLDRNELLLRAEALKTALLKKHQRRLNRLRKDKSHVDENCQRNESEKAVSLKLQSAAQGNQENESGLWLEDKGGVVEFTSKLDTEAFKENLNESVKSESHSDCSKNLVNVLEKWRINGEKKSDAPNTSLKKSTSKTRSKKKRRKSNSLNSEVKENDNDQIEEDDLALRSQLICDLIRKKSLKDMGKKSVLMDSVQTTAGQGHDENKAEMKHKALPLVKSSSFIKINSAKANKPRSLTKIPKPEIQRIIVHLGSKDSSDEESLPNSGQSNKAEESEDAGTPASDANVGTQPSITSAQANYEKSVELLLSQARKKVEGELHTAKNNHSTTPEAVYVHLPPSQRMEYMRLKQKIAERERLRKLKIQKGCSILNSHTGDSSLFVTTLGAGKVADKSLHENSKIKHKTQGGSSDCKTGASVQRMEKPTTVSGIKTLSSSKLQSNPCDQPTPQKPSENRVRLPNSKVVHSASGAGGKNSILAPSLQPLLAKLKLMLKKIKLEKTIEENYGKEIAKLKSQLKLIEKKKSEQRCKIKKLADDSMKIYKLMQTLAPSKKVEISKEKAETQNVAGVTPKDEGNKIGVPESAPSEARGETKTDIKDGTEKDITDVNEVDAIASDGASPSTIMDIIPYDSPLQAFKKALNCTDSLDPNTIVCQFDLTGVCKDEECTYQHLRTS